jgi:hypothetical protein
MKLRLQPYEELVNPNKTDFMNKRSNTSHSIYPLFKSFVKFNNSDYKSLGPDLCQSRPPKADELYRDRCRITTFFQPPIKLEVSQTTTSLNFNKVFMPLIPKEFEQMGKRTKPPKLSKKLFMHS